MLIFTAKLTRKRVVLWVVLAGVCAGLLVLGARHLASRPAEPPNGVPTEGVNDNAARIQFLEAYGWEVASDPVETLRLLLPGKPDETWKAYEDLQKSQGFDLSGSFGQRVERFTYTVLNYPGVPEGVQANLYLSDGTVVAGDIFCAGENGFQVNLLFPAEHAP